MMVVMTDYWLMFMLMGFKVGWLPLMDGWMQRWMVGWMHRWINE